MIKRSPVLKLNSDDVWTDSTNKNWLCHGGCNALWVLDEFDAIRIVGSNQPIRDSFMVKPKYGSWSYISFDIRYALVPQGCRYERYKIFADWLASFCTRFTAWGPVWIWIEEA